MDKHWLDDPVNVRRLWRGFLALLTLLVVVEFGIALHPHFGFDGLYAFHAWYGFLACGALILIAKLLGFVLKRPDDYYDDRHD